MERFSFMGLDPGLSGDNGDVSFSHIYGNNITPEKEQQIFLDSLLLIWLLALKATFLLVMLTGLPPPQTNHAERWFAFIMSFDVFNVTSLLSAYVFGEFQYTIEISVAYNVAGYATFAGFYFYFYTRSLRRAAAQPAGDNSTGEDDDDPGDVSNGAPDDRDFQTPRVDSDRRDSSSRNGAQQGRGGARRRKPRGRRLSGGCERDPDDEVATGSVQVPVELKMNGTPVGNTAPAENGLSTSSQDVNVTEGHPMENERENFLGKGATNGSTNGSEPVNGSESMNGTAANGSGNANADESANGSKNMTGGVQIQRNPNGTMNCSEPVNGSRNMNGEAVNGSANAKGDESSNGSENNGGIEIKKNPNTSDSKTNVTGKNVNGSASMNGSKSTDERGNTNGSEASNGAVSVATEHNDNVRESSNDNVHDNVRESNNDKVSESNGVMPAGNGAVNGVTYNRSDAHNGGAHNINGGRNIKKLVDSLLGPKVETASASATDIRHVPPKYAPLFVDTDSGASSTSPSSGEGFSPQTKHQMHGGQVLKLADGTGTDYYQKRSAEDQGEAASLEAN